MYIVEYSQSQGAFHIDDMKASAFSNTQAVLDGKPCDWICLGCFPSYEDASQWVAYVRQMLSGTLRVDENGQLKN